MLPEHQAHTLQADRKYDERTEQTMRHITDYAFTKVCEENFLHGFHT